MPEPLAWHFDEHAGRNLAFGLEPGGPLATADYRIAEGTDAIRRLIRTQIGPEAESWVLSRGEEARGSGYGASSWGAVIGASFDGAGLNKAQISYEWGPTLMDSLPASLYRVARAAMQLLPGLRPAFSTIHVDRSTGTQEFTFEMTKRTAARIARAADARARPRSPARLADELLAFVLGARFVLPPGTATITLKPCRGGVELRLDVDLERLPDVPEPLGPLLGLQMTERPASLRAWHNWMAAFTQEGHRRPGSFSVLSIRVRPDEAARIALHLRPALVEDDLYRGDDGIGDADGTYS